MRDGEENCRIACAFGPIFFPLSSISARHRAVFQDPTQSERAYQSIRYLSSLSVCVCVRFLPHTFIDTQLQASFDVLPKSSSQFSPPVLSRHRILTDCRVGESTFCPRTLTHSSHNVSLLVSCTSPLDPPETYRQTHTFSLSPIPSRQPELDKVVKLRSRVGVFFFLHTGGRKPSDTPDSLILISFPLSVW